MASLVRNFLNILIYPFTDHQLFVFIAGILICTWLFSIFFSLIRGNFDVHH